MRQRIPCPEIPAAYKTVKQAENQAMLGLASQQKRLRALAERVHVGKDFQIGRDHHCEQ